MKLVRFYLLINLLLSSLLLSKTNNLEKVSLQLQWKHQFEFAGFYIAKEKGYYKDLGLDVEIKEYELGIDIIDDVMSGKTTFATSYSSVVLEKFNGKNIVLLNAILQVSPHVLISLSSSGIKSVKDFKNKKIMIGSNAVKTATFSSMLQQNNISVNDMTIIKPTFNIEDLLNGTTDIITAFSSNEFYALDKKGIKYDVWDPEQYGFGLYNVITFTSAKEMTKNHKKVEAFNRATLKGWEYAFANIDEAADLILKKYNTQNRTKEALVYEAKALKKLAYKNNKSLGNIDKHNIQRIYDMYNIMGLIKHKIEFDQFIYKPMAENNRLTKKEINYLRKKNHIKMCIDPDWMPFEKFDEDGKHVGISRDYFDVFEAELNIPIQIVKTQSWSQTLEYAKTRKCDIISLAMQTKEREKYMNFTTSYLSVPLVLTTKNNIQFIDSLRDIKDQKIAIVKEYALVDTLKERYPNLNIIEVDSIQDGLDKVTRNELFGYIGSIIDIGYMFQINNMADLKISGKFNERWELGVAVRNDDKTLFNIFEKLVLNISKEKKEEIFNKYVSIKYEKGIDYTLIFYLLAFIIISISFFLYRQYILNKVNIELKLLASTDSMTKLYNRRYFMEISETLLDLAKRNNTEVSIIMLDIDNFKNINDTYGHKVGDDVIISLSSDLQKHGRKSDVVCRWGGEEFIILLPNTSSNGAQVIAQKIRKAIENVRISIEGKQELKFTVSIGVSYVCNESDSNIEPSIKRADEALYEAKENGRNQVVIHFE